MHSDVYEPVWFKTLRNDRYHFDTSLIQGHISARKQKLPLSHSFQLFGVEYGILLRLVTQSSLYLIGSIFKGENSTELVEICQRWL